MSLTFESQKQAKKIATSHRNLEVTSVNQRHINVISVSRKITELDLNMPEYVYVM